LIATAIQEEKCNMGALKEAFECMVRTLGSFDGQKQVGTGNAYIGTESSGRWSRIALLRKLGGSPPAFWQYPAPPICRPNQ
jgi:hypothetical protein